MLTRKQYDLLIYIHECLVNHGVPPSYDEMKEAVSLKSKSGIHRLITGLEERGFIRRLPHKARALEVVRLPENMPGEKPAHKGFEPTVITNDRLPMESSSPIIEADALSLPYYGRIAAGTPIEALRDETAQVDVPTSILSGGEHYALEVEGDSMVDAGIFEGDTVIIERCDVAENGCIVVALVDEAEVTLKRLRRKGDSIALEPANKDYETRIFGPDRVRVQGKLIGLMRSY
ncbi:MAG TPA: repressor LexA [Rhodospirillaceae bacterium]|nr:repressor LexA [Rhodospirillaceae bacterium]MBL25417.1 repressor LexA [Rhodospirillaceae bacterium]HAA92951.1 repressor LexA [Rhodospirillaceae bacterium]HAT36073.1 repressor LexA [Rhodospirillaceae bacterium]|tara:strand:- start:110 stop:805 length:696 start_codon:yes stop_codon:yes gene_type:complete